MRPGTAHEAPLLPAFQSWGVGSVVPPLAADAARGWLLLEDGGTTLRATRPDGEGDRDLDAWAGILAAYAELQRSVETRAGELLGLGVPDGRPETLDATLDRLIATDVWWVLVDDDERGATDAAREALRAFGPWVAERAGELAHSGIHSTIQHDDLHGGNVFVGPAGVRFFDWGDAVVGHPFASMVTTLNSIAYRLGIEADDRRLDRLRDAYLEGWTDVVPGRVLRDVLATAIDLGRIGKAAAWARALDGLDPADMAGHGGAPALWLADLVDRVGPQRGR
jgi:aminoglycoside/choline kinase family phosphotransferase